MNNFNPNYPLTLSLHNIDLISKSTDCRAESFCLQKHYAPGDIESHWLIQKNGKLTEFYLRILHLLWSGQAFFDELRTVIESDVQALSLADRSSYVASESREYTDLFLAAQRYNQVCHTQQDPALKEEISLFHQLSLKTLINSSQCPEIAPTCVKASQIVQSAMSNISKEQYPYVRQKGFWCQKNLYHYNEEDIDLNHGSEAMRIFISTQTERMLSLMGRAVESVAGFFGKTITAFNQYHYFRNQEDKTDAIYAHEAPLVNENCPTSYWIGHATCLINIPLKSKEDQIIRVNIITDPVEGDLNKVLYPRMTLPARFVDDYPVPHIYMLSHNHLDHYDKATLQKLKKYQPIMLVPQGDAEKLRRLGFKNVYEHNWWQTTTIPIQQGEQTVDLRITAVPANHWSGQGICDAHRSAFVGYVIHQEEGDIYFAGDTARLSQEHIATLRDRFNIRSMFQPGGPDEVRNDMKTTHQASVDALWMHFELMMRHLYDKGDYAHKSKIEFIEESKKQRTLFMHTKTYKLGNLHFDDTDESVNRVKEALHRKQFLSDMKVYEMQVYEELLTIGKELIFADDTHLEAKDILDIVNFGIIIPKIGSRTALRD